MTKLKDEFQSLKRYEKCVHITKSLIKYYEKQLPKYRESSRDKWETYRMLSIFYKDLRREKGYRNYLKKKLLEQSNLTG